MMATIYSPTSQVRNLGAAKTRSEIIVQQSRNATQLTNDQHTSRTPIELDARSRYKLDVAKQKLQRTNEPWLLRVTFYLRIFCSVIQTAVPVDALEDHSPQISYSQLMQALFNYHPEWWKQCSADETGKLVSNNPSISALLSPLDNL